ncbi:MAG TPA: PKD domain-containing protein, partial [Methanospirillum sp.]|uniref:PKD domain-containing protein n=1 Tax=Methanospirillum sp. TaxID=45200 RepID=UPI002C5D9558
MNHTRDTPENDGTRVICNISQITYLLIFFLLLSGNPAFADIIPGFAGVPTQGSAPLSVSFIDQSASNATITEYSWNFGDGSYNSTEKNPNHTYQGVGRYNVTLSITDLNGVNASTIQQKYIHVQPSAYPVVKFGAISQNSTPSQEVLFLDQSELDPDVPIAMYYYIWNFGDGSESGLSNSRIIKHRYSNPGDYLAQLQIQDQYGERHNAPDPVHITITNNTSSFLAGFSAIPPLGPAPLLVSFIDQSLSPVSITNYTWDFGDGSIPSSEKNPVHSYVGIGKYNVSLKITDANGANTTTILPYFIQVQPSKYPRVKFTTLPQNTQVNGDVYFIDQSQLDPAVPDEIYTYLWDFGDGSLSNASNTRNVQHRYTKPGNYTAQLQIQDQNGEKHNAPVPMMITITNQTSSTQASFTAKPLAGPSPLNVSFTDHSSSPASISAYAWSFGDSKTSTLKNPVHTYADPGSYNVTLTVTDADGIQATTTEPGYIHVQPSKDLKVTFNATPTKGSAPLKVLFTDQTELDPSIPIEKYKFSWNFGDNTPADRSNARTIEHHYKKPGTYSPTLEIQDPHKNKYISPNPVVITVTNQTNPVHAEFYAAPVNGSAPLKVSFFDQSTSPADHSKYLWDFGDGSRTSFEKDPTHIYGNAGIYDVTLKVSNEFGSDFLIRGNYINVSLPRFYVINATASANGAISPSGDVIVSAGADQSFTISPNSGSSIKDVQINRISIGPISTHTFAHVTSNQKIHADFEKSTVPLSAKFIVDKGSGPAPLTVQFTDTSTGSPNSWYWDFGDGSNSVKQNPSHTYTNS